MLFTTSSVGFNAALFTPWMCILCVWIRCFLVHVDEQILQTVYGSNNFRFPTDKSHDFQQLTIDTIAAGRRCGDDGGCQGAPHKNWCWEHIAAPCPLVVVVNCFYFYISIQSKRMGKSWFVQLSSRETGDVNSLCEELHPEFSGMPFTSSLAPTLLQWSARLGTDPMKHWRYISQMWWPHGITSCLIQEGYDSFSRPEVDSQYPWHGRPKKLMCQTSARHLLRQFLL